MTKPKTYTVRLVFNFGIRKHSGLSLEDATLEASEHLRRLGFEGDKLHVATSTEPHGNMTYQGIFGTTSFDLAWVESEQL